MTHPSVLSNYVEDELRDCCEWDWITIYISQYIPKDHVKEEQGEKLLWMIENSNQYDPTKNENIKAENGKKNWK